MDDVQPKQIQRGQWRIRRQLPSMCRDYNRRDGCSRSECQELHICFQFLRGSCKDKRCAKAHALETPKNLMLLSERGWSGPEDLSQALSVIQQWAIGRAVSVCFMYNMGSCTAGDCSRLHVCYRHALDACPLDDCGLSHDLLDGAHNVSLLKSAGLGDTPVSELLPKLREWTRRQAPPQPALCRSVYGRQGCQRHCLRLHYCEASARGRCRFGAKCFKGHSLQDVHNQRVLMFFGWTEEHVLQELKASASGRSTSQVSRPRTPFLVDDDEGAAGLRDSAPGSASGASTETSVKNSIDVDDGKQGESSSEASATPPGSYQQVCVQTARQRPQKTQGNTDLELETERQEWQRKEAEWQRKEEEWQRKETEWKEIDNTRKEKQAKEQKDLERARKEADDRLKAEIEQERQKREEEKQKHLREMSEKESRERELLQSFAKVANDLESSEKTMTAIKQMNVEYQQQIARSVESENQYKQKTADIAKEREEHKKNVDELTKLQELVRKQKGYVECSICLGIFVEPMTLDCAHTFCKNCFENTARGVGIMGMHQAKPCPLCRKMTTMRVPSLALKNIAACFPNDQERPPQRTPGAMGPVPRGIRFLTPEE